VSEKLVWKFVSVNVVVFCFATLGHGLFVTQRSKCVSCPAGCDTFLRLLYTVSQVNCNFCVYILILILGDKTCFSSHLCYSL
jgi:hypothetical protein